MSRNFNFQLTCHYWPLFYRMGNVSYVPYRYLSSLGRWYRVELIQINAPLVVNCSTLRLKSYCAYQLLFTISLFCDRFDSVELVLILTPSIDFDYLDRMQPKEKLLGNENFLLCVIHLILLFCFPLFWPPKMHRVANAQYLLCSTSYSPFLKLLWQFWNVICHKRDIFVRILPIPQTDQSSGLVSYFCTRVSSDTDQ